MALSADELETGKNYTVMFSNAENGKPMVMRGKFMGRNYADDLLFDLRPKAGTTTIDADRFREAVKALMHQEPRLPRPLHAPPIP